MIEKVLKTCLAIRKGRDRKPCFLGSYLSQCNSLGLSKTVSKLIRFEIFILKILIWIFMLQVTGISSLTRQRYRKGIMIQ